MSSVSGRVADFPEAAYFNLHSFEAFMAMETEADDVVCVSYPKCGTSWINFILYGLLRMDKHGCFLRDPEGDIGASGQIYPDGVRLKKTDSKEGGFMREWAFDDLLEQDRPRLFTSHIRAANLPASLAKRGRLVLMVRNPKDALVSWKLFAEKLGKFLPEMRQFASQDWQQAYDHFNQTEKSQNYRWGDYYTHLQDMVQMVDNLGDRAIVIFYEKLHEDFEGELSRLAAFLGVPLSQAKTDAIAKFTSVDTLRTSGTPGNHKVPVTLRKGGVGDCRNYLTRRHWDSMDAIFRERLGHLEVLQPLNMYMGPNFNINLSDAYLAA